MHQMMSSVLADPRAWLQFSSVMSGVQAVETCTCVAAQLIDGGLDLSRDGAAAVAAVGHKGWRGCPAPEGGGLSTLSCAGILMSWRHYSHDSPCCVALYERQKEQVCMAWRSMKRLCK